MKVTNVKKLLIRNAISAAGIFLSAILAVLQFEIAMIRNVVSQRWEHCLASVIIYADMVVIEGIKYHGIFNDVGKKGIKI